MPKQIIEINPFHGGMNNNTDPRDLQHDELAFAEDVMVDKIGRIRTGPAIVSHASNDPSITIDDISDRTGTSLFAFSNDYVNAGAEGNIIQNGSSGMNSIVWTGWSSGPTDWNANSSYFTFTGSSGGSDTISQAAADREDEGLNSQRYKLTYTISNYSLTSGTPGLTLKGGSGQFASSDQALTLADGTYTKTFTSHSSASTGAFSLQSNSVQVTYRLDNIKLEPIQFASTGDNYLALYMNTSPKYKFAIYSYSQDKWNFSNEGLRFESVSIAAKPVFSYVDGVLRIVDGLKGEQAYKIWYSYISRKRWGTSSVYVDKWITAQSYLLPPTDSEIVLSSAASTYSPNEGKIEIGSQGLARQASNTGSWNPHGLYNGTAASGSGANKLVSTGSPFTSSMVGLRIRRTNNFTDHTCLTNTTAGSGSTFGSNPRIIQINSTSRLVVGMIVSGNGIDGTAIITSIQSSTLFRIDEDVISTENNTTLTFNNDKATAIITKFEDANTIYVSKTITSHVSTDLIEKGNVLTWYNGDTFDIFDYYEIGFTWVYDGNQESLVHSRTTLVETVYNNISLYIQDIAAGYNWDTETTARKTGLNCYYKKESDDSNIWNHLFEIDLNKGFKLSSENDFSITWTQIVANTEYHLREIEIQDTLTFETYESRNGYKSDVNEFLDLSDDDGNGIGYSVSTIANRVHYIANVKYLNSEGAIRNYGDVMFKSVVNKFDTFPLSRRLEVSVQDGDEITALASYADRLLQYKKNKMHLINISQEVEFLEDTFKFKGVESQAAVCETDFGIAWVNQFGCYLYDGRQVNNLLEQKSIRKISESSWLDIDHKPMIAYLPKDRQLIIAKDHSGGSLSSGNGNAWIYDMVTRSWVMQAGSFIVGDGAGTSNFVTDHNGDIVYAIGTGTIRTLSTDSSPKTNIKIVTADMNYGDSGVRKKVYRVRLSYKGDASSLNVRYTTNGDTDTYKQFEGTSSGLPSGSATNTPLEDKSSDVSQWYHAELKPAVPSEATNIYSFQVHIDGAAQGDFEINDLSVVFRVKNVK